tara:strand:- start:3248 stop:3475 length:228 start_codon:yes stop_codon:yes gene_type:complete
MKLPDVHKWLYIVVIIFTGATVYGATMEKINQIEADLDNFVTNEKLETTEVKVDFIKEKVDSIDQKLDRLLERRN